MDPQPAGAAPQARVHSGRRAGCCSDKGAWLARSEHDPGSLAAEVFGRNREDGFYLVPTGALLREGQLLVDFSANRSANNFLQLPSTVATEAAKKNTMFQSADPPANARPDLKALQKFLQRKFPGFPVPDSLP